MKKTLILDSNNLLYRIFFMNQNRAADVDLKLVFLRCIKSYVNLINGADEIYSVWDARIDADSTNFRKDEIDVDYKGNRNYEDIELAHEHDDAIMELSESLGIKNMFPKVMEADDVIAWLTRKLPGQKTVVTVDQDMLQLIDRETSVYSPIKKVMITTDNFHEMTGTTISKFLDYKALQGDKSDNIPGVPRVGKKTALKLVNEDIETSISSEDYKIYEKNKKLMDLSYGYTVHEGEEDCYKHQLTKCSNISANLDKFKELCYKHELFSIVHKFNDWQSSFSTNKKVEEAVVSLMERLNISV